MELNMNVNMNMKVEAAGKRCLPDVVAARLSYNLYPRLLGLLSCSFLHLSYFFLTTYIVLDPLTRQIL